MEEKKEAGYSLPKSLIKRVKNIAVEREISASAVVEEALRRYLPELEKGKGKG